MKELGGRFEVLNESVSIEPELTLNFCRVIPMGL
jgi:hypothetical protein